MSPSPPTPEPQALAEALPEALARGELALVWQPQVALDNGGIVGAEALLRWHHPAWGELAPGRWLPQAQALGMDTVIDTWVLDQACAQGAAWQRALGHAAPRVSVNLAPRQWQQGGLLARVRQALQRHGLAPERLGLELTEGALRTGPGPAVDELHALQALGVALALDDFGTGPSSLSLLRSLPLDLVKVDRSFVHDVAAAANSASVTRSIIDLAHQLRLHVLAEGVETTEQLQCLLDHGCDQIQGHVFAPPLPAAALTPWLRERRHLAPQHTRAQAQRRTLLLVDDEPSVLSALKRLFRRDGYTLLSADSGAQALELLASQPVDVILSDQRMPGMTGVDFLRRARALRPDTVRITLSGYTDMQTIIDAVNEGAVYKFLTKPWDDERLRAHVAEALRLRELAAQNQRLSHQIASANTELAQANRRLAQRVAVEHERVQSLMAVTSDTLDLMDLLPMAVFGVDPEGLLVHVNHLARQRLPDWALALGNDAPPPLQALLQRLREASLEAPDLPLQQGTTAWRARRRALAAGRGELLLLTPEPLLLLA